MSLFPVKNPEIVQVLQYLKPFLHGKDDALIKILVGALSGGHILLEDLPGLGKTTMTIAFARAMGLRLGRVQCTNDLLPTDVTGLNIFRAESGAFEFRPGPVFNNLLLVDEINRATPKTQSALLEAMGEGQVTIDGRSYELEKPFLVIATQNPIEHVGTFSLPESQMDRFMMKISIGYPSRESESDILRYGKQRRGIEEMPPILTAQRVLEIQEKIETGVTASEKILNYILTIAEKTRKHALISFGISTRGAMILLQCAKTVAWMQGRDFVIPEDVKTLAPDVLAHRILLESSSQTGAAETLNMIFQDTPAL